MRNCEEGSTRWEKCPSYTRWTACAKITDTAVLLPVSSSEYNSILSMVRVRAEIKKTICIISTQIIVSG